MENKLDGGPPVPVWLTEPNEYRWVDEATSLPCHLLRNEMTGTWCGYVELPPEHHFYGMRPAGLEVHGGVTWAGSRNGIEGEWSVGFDCAHSFDYMPGMVAMFEQLAQQSDISRRLIEQMEQTQQQLPAYLRQTYRTFDYAKQQTTALAAQLRPTITSAPPTHEPDTFVSLPPQD